MNVDQLDALDRDIIRQLEADGRRPFREIARSLDVSEATVRVRVRKLQDSGVLKIVAFADPSRLGNSLLALLILRVEARGRTAVVEQLSSRSEVRYVSTVLGRGDVFAQVLVRDLEALYSFLNDYVESLPGVLETETLVEVQVHKLQFASPPTG